MGAPPKKDDDPLFDPAEASPKRLQDLAEMAGVSIATVSRALRNSPLVSDRTKVKIRKLARDSQYEGRTMGPVANASASPLLSIVVPSPQGRDRRISDPFLLELIGGLADAGQEKGCDIMLSHVMPSDSAMIAKLDLPSYSDGLIFLGQSTLHEHLNKLVQKSVPFVVWGAMQPDQQYCSVGSDNMQGGQRATDHLIRLGRKRIVFLGNTDAPEAMLRYQGYVNALERSGNTVDSALVRPADFSFESGAEAVETLLEAGVRPDGIFAASDLIAMGAIRALTQRGLRIPDDVSIVGYDDIRMASYTSPALTTVRQDVNRAGRRLIGKLLRIREGDQVRPELLPTDLIVRESCGA
ncbi:MAG: LacI family DNA-binding transcriptional regulator [Kordiimonadaceae bacterium]|nr:LacI family DNA-binding transcriptional regulator [Kordiimonadaceae bacterium]MBO6567357.1 LacI family DNA-binding transcriptional regulator [Kordiimonadaceae bacterium]MBO6963429.1 LacI family DNA-binding transcriptional regulator [Kordiimonadaceae bacterium]